MKDVANQEAGQSSRPTVFRVSSQDVPEPHGLEYCATFLGSALVPTSLVCADADVFRSELNVAPLASISIVRSFGTDHDALRTERDLTRNQDWSFFLLTSLESGLRPRKSARARDFPTALFRPRAANALRAYASRHRSTTCREAIRLNPVPHRSCRKRADASATKV